MRKCALLAATTALSLAGAANGDFVVRAFEEPAPGGYDRWSFYALAQPGATPGPDTRLLASDITLQDLSGHNLRISFVSTFGSAKADLTGSSAASGDPYHPIGSIVNLLGDANDPTGMDNDPTAYSVVSTTPTNTHANFVDPNAPTGFGGVPKFEVVGANLAGGVDASSVANGGRGALIAVAVVPHGDQVCLGGSVGGTSGGPQFVGNILCPEPATVGFLSVGLGGLVVRRRRRPVAARMAS